MFSKLNLYIIALCCFSITASALAQPGQDSTSLSKMKASDFKAMESGVPVTVLTKGNMKDTFKGMQVTVDNSGDYATYHEDLQYKVVEHSGKLAIQRYTPKNTCNNMYKAARNMCIANDKRLAGRFSIMCVIPEGAKSCSSAGNYYELTLSGLRIGESYAACWSFPMPVVRVGWKCGYRQRAQRVYIWNAPVAIK